MNRNLRTPKLESEYDDREGATSAAPSPNSSAPAWSRAIIRATEWTTTTAARSAKPSIRSRRRHGALWVGPVMEVKAGQLLAAAPEESYFPGY